MKFTIETEVIEKVIGGVEYVEEITYKVYEDGTKEIACTVECPKATESVEPEPSQLDRMEEKIDTLVSGTTSENTEAINAFLGA